MRRWTTDKHMTLPEVAKTTIRQATENLKRVGITKQLGAGQGQAYDPTEVAKTTIRQTTENLKRVGITKQLGAGQGLAYDPTEVAKTTVRQTTEDLNRKGIVSNAIQKRHIAYDPTEVAKTTVKETTENMNRKGIVRMRYRNGILHTTLLMLFQPPLREQPKTWSERAISGGLRFQNGNGYKVTNAYANNTNRQFTQDFYWSPPAGAVIKKNAKVSDAEYNAQVNVNKELIAAGREPTRESVKLTNPLNNMTNYEVKKIMEILLIGAGQLKHQTWVIILILIQ